MERLHCIMHVNLDTLKLSLSRKEIDFNKIDYIGDTPLHLACYFGQRDIIKLILDNAQFKGINFKTRNVDNETAEDLARLEGHSYVPQLFLEAEAEIELRNFKRKHGIAFPKIKETRKRQSK